MSSRQSHFRFLCTFAYVYFFGQAMTMSMLVLWLGSDLHLSGAQTGIVLSTNFVAAMCSQPAYGYLSDKVGMRKNVLWTVAGLCMLSGPFLVYAYAPLLKSHLVLGALLGGAFLGVTFIAGSYAVESYVDRIGRAYGFEYSRVRMWGSLGFASAAFMTGRLYNLNPHINFMLASGAGLVLVAMLAVWRLPAHETTAASAAGPRLADALLLLRSPTFWRFMAFILTVTNLYLVYDSQFSRYFAAQFPDKETGAVMFGDLSSAQIFLEAGGLFVAPLVVRRIGAKNGLLLAGTIMMLRIGGSSLPGGPIWISAMKLLHSLELPILVVSIFRYVAYHFDKRLTSTVYMVGVSFGHSLGLSLLSPLVGYGYDRIGFPSTYLLLALTGAFCLVVSAFVLAPTPPEHPTPPKRDRAGAIASDGANLTQ